MIDYSGWERSEFSVISLQLDPLNPRVSNTGQGQIDQSNLLRIFIEAYNVYDLAESISKNGYFPDEVIMICREDAKNRFVLEGNRRIAALKLLLNPESAPDKYKSKFRTLSASVNKALIQKVIAVVAPSREDATPIIIEKHTHTPVKPWSVLMEATYINNLLGDADNKSTTLAQLGLSIKDFDRFKKMNMMYELAIALDLPDKVMDKLRNKEKFPMTTVERLYNNTASIRQVLGLSDDLEEISDLDTFNKLYSIIITDICEKNETSRTLDTLADRERYASKLKSKAPVVDKPQSTKAKDIISTNKRKDNESTIAEKKVKARSTRKSKGIIPPGFAYRINQGASVRKLCDQLKKLPVEHYPDVSAISFRIFLEKSIKIFLKMNGIKNIPITPLPSKKEDSISLSDAQLGPLLDYLGKSNTPLINDSSVKKNLRIFKSASDFPSLSILNSIIHNEELCFSEDQVRKLWPSLERLFIIMLSESEQNDG